MSYVPSVTAASQYPFISRVNAIVNQTLLPNRYTYFLIKNNITNKSFIYGPVLIKKYTD